MIALLLFSVPKFPVVDTDWTKGSYDQSKVAISKYLKATTALRTAENYSIDSSRLYITGLSMGGYGTRITLPATLDLFAAAIPIAVPAILQGPKLLRICLFGHSTVMQTMWCPYKVRAIWFEALEALDSPIKYTEYVGVGHDCWNNAYQEAELLLVGLHR